MVSGGQDEEADVGCLVVPEGRAVGFLVEPALEQQILKLLHYLNQQGAQRSLLAASLPIHGVLSG